MMILIFMQSDNSVLSGCSVSALLCCVTVLCQLTVLVLRIYTFACARLRKKPFVVRPCKLSQLFICFILNDFILSIYLNILIDFTLLKPTKQII